MTKVHLLEAPMQFSDSVKKFEADVEVLLSRKADIVGLTEAGSSRHKALVRAAKNAGYQLVHPHFPEKQFPSLANERVTCPILVKDEHEVRKDWYVHGIDANPKPPRQGGHGPRGWTFARVKVGDEIIVVSQGHLITKGRNPDDGARFKQNTTMLRKGTTVLKREAKGPRVGVMMADMNLPDNQLDIPGLTSIWDERKRPENPIVNILTLDQDSRVKITRIRRWPLMNSDHQPFSAWMEIEEKQGKKTADEDVS